MELWAWIVGSIITLATLVTAITTIWRATKSVGAATENKVREVARDEVSRSNTKLMETNSLLVQQLKDTIFRAIDDNFKVIGFEIRELRDDLNDFIREQTVKNNIMAQGHIETWKKEIRTVYFKLRNTGEIPDHEKSYVDKIYHVYKDLGGNSDIDAKYKEICDVYARITHKRYEELNPGLKQVDK